MTRPPTLPCFWKGRTTRGRTRWCAALYRRTNFAQRCTAAPTTCEALYRRAVNEATFAKRCTAGPTFANRCTGEPVRKRPKRTPHSPKRPSTWGVALYRHCAVQPRAPPFHEPCSKHPLHGACTSLKLFTTLLGVVPPNCLPRNCATLLSSVVPPDLKNLRELSPHFWVGGSGKSESATASSQNGHGLGCDVLVLLFVKTKQNNKF